MTATVTVLLGSRFAALAEHGTRWRAVLVRWARDPRVGQLTVVDYPRFRPGPARCRVQPSWLAGVRSLHLTVPTRTRPAGWDGVAWRLAGRAVRRHVPADSVSVAATPLWVPLLDHLGASRTCFDGVDDWREYPAARALRARVEQGYTRAAACDAATAVSPELSRRLRSDYGLRAQVVANGVDLDAYRAAAPAPDGLPAGPFAVYVGVVEERVDVALLLAAAGALPVVVAGPASGPAAEALRAAPLTWLGPIDVQQVPGLLQRATVGLLPHRVDAFTASMSPMKLLEYLAAGLPVVATPVPGVELSPRVQVADGPVAFAAAVTRAAETGRHDEPDPAVLDRDWDAVADRLLNAYLGAAA